MGRPCFSVKPRHSEVRLFEMNEMMMRGFAVVFIAAAMQRTRSSCELCALHSHTERESDHVDAVVFDQCVEDGGHAAGRSEPRHADGVNGIGEVALDPENLLQTAIGARVDLREMKGCRLAHVSDQSGGAARHGEHRNAITFGQRCCLEERRGLEESVDGVDKSHAVLMKQRGKGLVAPGKGTRVRERCPLSAFTLPELQHHQWLYARRALDRAAEPPTIADTLNNAGEHLGGRVVGEIIDIIGDLHHGAVAAGDEIIEADTAIGGQFRDRVQEPARLGDERNAPGNRAFRNVGHGRGKAVSETRYSHAIWARNRHAARPGERHQLALSRLALATRHISETLGDDEGAPYSLACGLAQERNNRLGRHSHDQTVGNAGQGRERLRTRNAGDHRGIRMYRP